jgi:hypothetical protein
MVVVEILRLLRVGAVLAGGLPGQAAVMAVMAEVLLLFSAVLLAVAVRVDTPEMVVKAQPIMQLLALVAHSPALEVRAGAVLVAFPTLVAAAAAV